jgi:hypothetical protein
MSNIRMSREKKQESATSHSALKQALRVTSGKLVSEGSHHVNTMLEPVLRSKELQASAERQAAAKDTEKQEKRETAARAAYQKENNCAGALNATDLRALLRFTQDIKRRPADPSCAAMNKAELVVCWNERKTRPEVILQLKSLIGVELPRDLLSEADEIVKMLESSRLESSDDECSEADEIV